MRDLNSRTFDRTGGDGRTDRLSGSYARRPSRRSSSEDADSGSLYGAGEDQECQGNPKEFLTPGVIGLNVR